jgi:hypothetical protein
MARLVTIDEGHSKPMFLTLICRLVPCVDHVTLTMCGGIDSSLGSADLGLRHHRTIFYRLPLLDKDLDI